MFLFFFIFLLNDYEGLESWKMQKIIPCLAHAIGV